MLTHYMALTNAVSLTQHCALFFPDTLVNLQITETIITLTVQVKNDRAWEEAIKEELTKLRLSDSIIGVKHYPEEKRAHIVLTYKTEAPNEEYF